MGWCSPGETYRGTHKLDLYGSYGISNYTWKAFECHNINSKYKPELFKEGEMNMHCFVKQWIRGGMGE